MHFTEQLGEETQSINEIWPVYVTLRKTKISSKNSAKNVT